MIVLLKLTYVDTSYRRDQYNTSEISYVEITNWGELYYYESLNDSEDYEGYYTSKFKMNKNDKWLTFEEFYKKYSRKIESPEFKYIGMEIVNDNYEVEFHNKNTDF